MLRVLVIALLVLAGAMLWMNRLTHRAPEVATVLPSPLALPAVTLTDEHGAPFATASALNGRYTLLFFGFTHCPDICPLTLQTLAGVRADLLARHLEPPDVLFVSVDPARDEPERIASYLANFDVAFRGVTGTRGELERLEQALGVTVHIQPGPSDESYTVTHNSTIYVIDPEGQLAAVFSAPHEAAAIARDYLRIRQQHRPRNRGSAGSS